MGLPLSVNTLHQGQWRMSMTNVPSYPIGKEYDAKMLDMQIFNLFYKSLTLPDLQVKYNYDVKNGAGRWFPVPHYNKDWPGFQIQFKVNETMENYIRFYFWMISLRFGYAAHNETTQVDSVIKAVTIHILDNERRPISKIEMIDCILENVSNLTLQQGTSEEMTFTVSLKPAQVHYDFLPQP